MSKVIFTIVAIIVLNILPLLGNPELILHYKTVLLVIAAGSLWLSQPAFSSKDTNEHKGSDKMTILVILIMSSASVLFSVIEWAYFTNTASSSLLLNVAGIILLLTGIGIRIWAIQILGKHFTATVTLTENHQVITKGPYKFVRHPSYLGAFLAIIGAAVFLNSAWATLFAAVCMSVAYYFRISVEEQMLSSYFGKSYEGYKQKTKMFIPFIW